MHRSKCTANEAADHVSDNWQLKPKRLSDNAANFGTCHIACRNNDAVCKCRAHLSSRHHACCDLNAVLHSLQYDRNDGAYHCGIRALECFAQQALFTHNQNGAGNRAAKKTFCASRYCLCTHLFQMLHIDLASHDEVVNSFVYLWCHLNGNRDRRCSSTCLHCLLQYVFGLYGAISADAEIFGVEFIPLNATSHFQIVFF